MTLADDIETLRALRADCDFYAGPRSRVAALDRVIAILEPLAPLSEKQCVYAARFLKRESFLAETVIASRDDDPVFQHAINKERAENRTHMAVCDALAAALTAMRGKR